MGIIPKHSTLFISVEVRYAFKKEIEYFQETKYILGHSVTKFAC